MRPIRILVVDDHAVLRAALRSLLETEPDLCVAGEATGGDEALEAAMELQPDVVLMDLSMPRGGGVEATRAIAARSSARVLVLSMYAEAEGVPPALHAGASGYLCKTAPPGEVIRAIRAVARGEVVLSPPGMRALVHAVVPRGARSPGRAARATLGKG